MMKKFAIQNSAECIVLVCIPSHSENRTIYDNQVQVTANSSDTGEYASECCRIGKSTHKESSQRKGLRKLPHLTSE